MSILTIILILILIILCYYLIINNNILNINTSSADIIIIGLGTAGSILARRLHDSLPKHKILILEKGRNNRNDPIIYNPSNAAIAAYSSNYSTLLKSDNPNVQVTAGTMYGGSSCHNFGLCVHGTLSFYKKEWLKYLNITLHDLIKYIKRIEKYNGNSEHNDMRGNQGLLQVTPVPEYINLLPRILPFINRTVTHGPKIIVKSIDTYFNLGPLRASQNFCNNLNLAVSKIKNVPIVEDYNVYNNSISSTQQLFIDYVTGLRSSTDVAYLPNNYINMDEIGRAVSSDNNLQILPYSNVQKIYSDKVEWLDYNNLFHSTKLNNNGKIIISTGSIFTPYLLQKSKLNMQAGNNLITHYGTTMIIKVKSDQYESFNFSAGPVAFLPNDNNNNRDLQFLCGGETLLNKDLLNVDGVNSNKTHNEKYIIFLIWNLRPRTRGKINFDNDDINVQLNLFKDGDLNDKDSDLSIIMNGTYLMRDIYLELKKTYASMDLIYPPPFAFDNHDNLEFYIKEGVSLTDHYCSTCKLGTIVNENDFSLKNYPNIHIVDASIFPSIPDGNTEFPTCLITEVACDKLIQQLKI